MIHGQSSCRALALPPGGFTCTDLEYLCSAQVSHFNWVGVTMKMACTGFALALCVCISIIWNVSDYHCCYMDDCFIDKNHVLK